MAAHIPSNLGRLTTASRSNARPRSWEWRDDRAIWAEATARATRAHQSHRVPNTLSAHAAARTSSMVATLKSPATSTPNKGGRRRTSLNLTQAPSSKASSSPASTVSSPRASRAISPVDSHGLGVPLREGLQKARAAEHRSAGAIDSRRPLTGERQTSGGIELGGGVWGRLCWLSSFDAPRKAELELERERLRVDLEGRATAQAPPIPISRTPSNALLNASALQPTSAAPPSSRDQATTAPLPCRSSSLAAAIVAARSFAAEPPRSPIQPPTDGINPLRGLAQRRRLIERPPPLLRLVSGEQLCVS